MFEKLGGGGAVTVMVAPADFEESACDVAASITVAGLGTADGAVYVTDVLDWFESVPHEGPLHPDPESVQVTPLFEESLETVALKFADVPVWTEV